MKFFGRKSAGRADVRPALSRGFSLWNAAAMPRTYEERVREGYAVFEAMALGPFGNRIPSLSFEVFADAGDVATGTIISEVSGVASDAGPLVGGIVISGDSAGGCAECDRATYPVFACRGCRRAAGTVRATRRGWY